MSKITKINVGGTDYEIGGSGGGVMTEISYADLKSLAESSGLIPGNKYRITDYVTTVDSTKTYPYKSAEHPFDIVVTAVTDSALDANAKAMPHEGDEYFADCNLFAWELKYSLEPNIDNYPLIPDLNGKGTIYYMLDEFGNEANYDFKNILWETTSSEAKFIDEGNTIYYYTFSEATELTDTNPADASLSGDAHDNKIVFKAILGSGSEKVVLLGIATSAFTQFDIAYNTITGCAFLPVSSMLAVDITYNTIKGIAYSQLEISSIFSFNDIKGGLSIKSESIAKAREFQNNIVLGKNNPLPSLYMDSDSLAVSRCLIILNNSAHLAEGITGKVAVLGEQTNYFPASS